MENQSFNRVHLPTAEVRKAFALMLNVIPRNPIIPILDYFLIRIKKGSVFFICSDLQNYLTLEIAHDINYQDTEFLVDFDVAFKIIRLIKSENVSFRYDGENVVISCTDGMFTCDSTPADNYPKAPSFSHASVTQSMPMKMLKEALPVTVEASSTDDLRPAMTGVCVSTYEGEIEFCSTDGHRLVMYKTGIKSETDFVFIIQRWAARILESIKGYDDRDVKFEFGATNVRFTVGHVQLISRIIDERFPDYRNAIPMHDIHVVEMHIEPFLHCVRLAKIMSNTTTRQIVLDFGPMWLTIRSADLDCSLKSEQIMALNSGFNLIIGFNANFLEALLRRHAKKVGKFNLVAHNRAAVIDVPITYGSELRLLIMPVMLNEPYSH